MLDVLACGTFFGKSWILGTLLLRLFSFEAAVSVKFRSALSSQEPSRVPVILKDADGSSCPATLPVQLPHKLLEFLLTSCELIIPDSVVVEYWRHLEEVNDELAVASANFRSLAGDPVIPVGLHGDEASIGLVNGPHEKIVAFSMSLPLFRPRATRLSRFLLWSVEQQEIWSLEDTIYPMLSAVVDSLNLCAERAVASRRFLVTELRGDQVWIRYLFQHHSWWKRNEVCYRCEASCKGPISYLSYDGWLPSKRSTLDFLAHELRTEPLCSPPERNQSLIFGNTHGCRVLAFFIINCGFGIVVDLNIGNKWKQICLCQLRPIGELAFLFHWQHSALHTAHSEFVTATHIKWIGYVPWRTKHCFERCELLTSILVLQTNIFFDDYTYRLNHQNIESTNIARFAAKGYAASHEVFWSGASWRGPGWIQGRVQRCF